MRLRNVGNSIYRGFDPGAGRVIEVRPGSEVDVSEAKAEQLLADFPDNWRPVGGEAGTEVEAKEAQPARDKMVRGSKRRKRRGDSD